MFKAFLQGKPFGHPLHPMLTHLPIGLFVLSLGFDLATLIVNVGSTLVQAAFYSMLLAEGAALLTALPGLVDWMDIRRDHPGKKFANLHLILNLFMVGLYGVNLWLRSSSLVASITPSLPFLMSIVGIGVLSISGYLGGLLVYEYGIGVGRHRRETPTPSETIVLAPSQLLDDGFLRIDSGVINLAEGETMRLEINHQVLTLVNVKGHFYAIQDFCTHMFGPLSEGGVCDGQVECPWHQSRFDLRTGAVTQGPASLPLRTFEVITDHEDIYIRVGEIKARKGRENKKEEREWALAR